MRSRSASLSWGCLTGECAWRGGGKARRESRALRADRSADPRPSRHGDITALPGAGEANREQCEAKRAVRTGQGEQSSERHANSEVPRGAARRDGERVPVRTKDAA